MRRTNKKSDKEGPVESQAEQLDIQEEDDGEGALGMDDDEDDAQMDVDFDPADDDQNSKSLRKGSKASRQQSYDKKDKPLTKYEMDKSDLESAPCISRSEMSPAAFIFAPSEEEQQQIIFEEKSQKVKCPHCDAVSYSIVAYETNLLGYLLAVLGILVFGLLSLLMMPFLVGLTKQAVHKCAKCLNDVKQSNMFGLNSLEDKVIAKKFGSVGIILTRRYLLYIAMVIFALLSIYTFVLVDSKAHSNRQISHITWETYREDCGYEAFTANPRKAFRAFEMKYFGKNVGWNAYVVRVNLNDDDPLSLAYHSANILVKMEKSDIPGGEGADYGVTMSEFNVERFGETIESLHLGDRITFNGTLISLGDRHHLHHVRAFGIKKIDGHMDLHAHAHTQGRYKLKLEHNMTEEIKHY